MRWIPVAFVICILATSTSACSQTVSVDRIYENPSEFHKHRVVLTGVLLTERENQGFYSFDYSTENCTKLGHGISLDSKSLILLSNYISKTGKNIITLSGYFENNIDKRAYEGPPRQEAGEMVISIGIIGPGPLSEVRVISGEARKLPPLCVDR